MTPIPLAVHDKVHFTGPLGLINTGTVLKIEDGVAVVAVDVPLCTFAVHDLTVVGNVNDPSAPIDVPTQVSPVDTAAAPENVVALPPEGAV
jgi:hypothetical protein